MMSDEQAADVVNYVRSHFGNDYRDTVSAAAVQAARKIPFPGRRDGETEAGGQALDAEPARRAWSRST